MMLNNESVRDWFGHSRRERRASLILLMIIILIIAARYAVPVQNMKVEDLSTMLPDSGDMADTSNYEVLPARTLFAFDPNSASYDTLVKLGFAEKQARTLMKYRSKGGKFKKPSDIQKIYGVDSDAASRLGRYMVFSDRGQMKQVIDSSNRKRPLLDLNRSDSTSLVALPGIGPVLSVRIIRYRNLLGGFACVEQLKEVYGLSPEIFDIVSKRVYADSSGVRKISVNTADYRTLSRIIYLDKYEIAAILKYRELSGRINGIDDLKNNKILSAEKAGKVRPYFDFR
jgi:competence protein ComEA